jgi:hypothetical protein
MKRLVLTLVLPLAIACAPDTTVRLSNAAKLDSSCSASGDLSIGSGQIDLSATNRYLAQFTVISNLAELSLTVGSDVLSGPNRNDAIIQQVQFRYSSTPNLGLRTETQALHFVVSPRTDDNLLGMNLIGPVAATQLSESIEVGTSALVNVGIQVRGQLASGGGFTSNEIVFPIYVYRTDPAACPGGTTFSAPGPCGNNGQDESFLRCQ